jgi:polyisoprenoid-binding protein YceI
MKSILIGMLSTLLTTVPLVDNWTVDTAGMAINFSVKGPFGTVHGHFTGLQATLAFSAQDPSGSSFKAVIDVKTVKTGIGKRDKDLCNESVWFNAASFPDITFTSKSIAKSDDGFVAEGELTMKGVTKPLKIPFTFSSTGATGVFKGSFTINREDFNVGKQGGSVGNTITISLDVPVKK